MNQQAFSQIINAGEPVSITAELLDAARKSAVRHRTEALAHGAGWIRDRAEAAIKQWSPRASGLCHGGS